MQTPFSSALLAAFMLHVVGLVVASLGWQVWHVPFVLIQPGPPALVAVVPVPEPTPPPEPVAPPAPAAIPPTDAVLQPAPAIPVMSAPMVPPQDVPPPPLKRVVPRSNPARAQAQTATARPTRERLLPPPLPAPTLSGTHLGSPGRGTAGPLSPSATPELPQNPIPDGGSGPLNWAVSSRQGNGVSKLPTQSQGADAGQLSAHGDVPVAPGSGTGGGGVRVGTGGGASSSTGAGTGGGGGSARPVGGYQVKPRYPESARRQGVEGTVLLKMRITEHGRVADIQVERSAGHPDLDQSAMEAVQRWRFEPARRSGEPVAVWVLIPVEFKLQ